VTERRARTKTPPVWKDTRVPRPRPGLTRDAILGAAVGIIDESGLDACTMRAVAAELGVEAMSLYWHVPGKEALLDGIVDRILGEVAAEREEVGDWRTRVASFGDSFHRVLLRHPNALPLIAGRPFGAYAAAGRMAEVGIASLEEAGFDRRSAIRAARTISRFVIGFTLLEAGLKAPLSPPLPDAPALAEILDAVATEDPDELFRFGLETMVDGLEARLRRA
jgi:TetR/AcrR family tetracycline transcriptional repressor